MTVKLGTNPIAWSNDDMQTLGAHISLETCLTQARSAGFSGIELGHKFPREADKLRPILEAHDISLVGGWYSTELLDRDVKAEIEATQDHLELLKAMGCSVYIIAETSNAIHGAVETKLSDRPYMDDDQWFTFCDRMSDFCAYIRDQGFAPAYHHHMGTVVETQSEIDRFMAMTSEDVGLLIDAGHTTFAGGDPVQVAKDHGSRITHVHCKDIRLNVRDAAKENDQSFLNAVVDGVYTVPGDGDVDFASVLKELKMHDYSGWLVVEAEQDPDKASPEEYANLGCANLTRLASEAGFEVEQ